jgi:hypothetical protein
MRMRYLGLILAAAIAAIATQYGTATKSETLSVGTVNIMELQMEVGKHLPIMVIADLT